MSRLPPRCAFDRLRAILAVAAIGIALVAIHHLRRARPIAVPVEDTPDAAAALRSLSGKDAPVPKPWAADFAEFINDHPRSVWIIGRCARPCLSQAEAMDEARRDAARQIVPIVAAEVNPLPWDRTRLNERVLDDLRSGGLESDRDVERFDRPYGSVWTTSILVDASPRRIEPLAVSARADLRALHRRSAGRFAAFGIIAVASLLGYLILNWITRGYFTLRLRLGALAIVAAALLLLA